MPSSVRSSGPSATSAAWRRPMGRRCGDLKTFANTSAPFHIGLAIAHIADDECLYTAFAQLALDAVGEKFAHDHHEADAAVEDLVHLGLFDVAELLQPIEDGRHRPTAAL